MVIWYKCYAIQLLSHPGILAPTDSCSCNNFWNFFLISFIFRTIVGPDLWITWLDFSRFLLWPWPRFVKAKCGICCISAKSGPVATKWKANILVELQASNVTNGFDLDHDLDLWILKLKCDLELWPHTRPWPWIFMVKFWNSCISEWEGRLTLHTGGGNRSFMTMAMTIWWPRSGVWIYQIVIGWLHLSMCLWLI